MPKVLLPWCCVNFPWGDVNKCLPTPEQVKEHLYPNLATRTSKRLRFSYRNMSNGLLLEASPRRVCHEKVPPQHRQRLFHHCKDGVALWLTFCPLYISAPNEPNCVQLGGGDEGGAGWNLRRGPLTFPRPLSAREHQWI